MTGTDHASRGGPPATPLPTPNGKAADGKPGRGPLVTAAFFLLLLFLELLLRAVSGDKNNLRVFLEEGLAFQQPCAARIRDHRGERIVAKASRGHFDYPFDRTAGVLRIAVVGESTGAFLGDALTYFAQEDATEVLNCAMPGSALEHLQMRTREVEDYQPDVIVIVFGHNLNFRYPMQPWLLHIWTMVSYSRLLSLALPSGPPAPDAAQVQLRIDAYRQWLESLVGAQRRPAPHLVLTTLPANPWVPTSDALDCGDETDVLAARFDWYAGRRARAIERLENALERTSDSCRIFELAVMLRREGRVADASRRVNQLRTSRYWAEDRVPVAANEMLRGVAAAHGLPLFDLDRGAVARAANAAPGWEQMRDHCHLSDYWIASEGLDLMAMARQLLHLPAHRGNSTPEDYIGAPSFRAAFDSAVSAHHASNPDQARQWLVAISLIIESWSGLPHGPDENTLNTFVGSTLAEVEPDPTHRASVLQSMAEGLWHSQRRSEAAALNRLAREQGAPEAWLQQAYFELATDPEVAAVAAARALELDPWSTAAADLVRRIAAERRHGRGESNPPRP